MPIVKYCNYLALWEGEETLDNAFEAVAALVPRVPSDETLYEMYLSFLYFLHHKRCPQCDCTFMYTSRNSETLFSAALLEEVRRAVFCVENTILSEQDSFNLCALMYDCVG